MRIGIDARFLTHPQHGGYKTYTECLVSALAAIDSDNDLINSMSNTAIPPSVMPFDTNSVRNAIAQMTQR